MRRLLVFLLLLGLAGPAFSANVGTTAEPKPAGVIYEGGGRVGGDTIGDATVIPGLPYTDAGSTGGYVNDYDEVCPYSGSTSPDVVYAYTAPVGAQPIDVDLCSSLYDTKVYVYDNAAGNLVACNDDFGCGYSGWQSMIEGIEVVAGHTYYIVIDGYGGSSGEYTLSVTEFVPCTVECPAGASSEGEPPCVENYYDTYDGGCNTTGWVYIPAWQNCATMCGKSCTYLYNGLSYRDTDWYTCDALGGNVTMTCTAEFPLQLIFIYGTGCSNLQYQYVQVPECTEASLSWNMAPNAELWPWVGPSVFSGVPESDYVLEVCGIGSVIPPPDPPNATQEASWGQIKAAYR